MFLFQQAPTLGGECYRTGWCAISRRAIPLFQQAPTLGGECYLYESEPAKTLLAILFQRAPTLGGECYARVWMSMRPSGRRCFNGHPPLGVNATYDEYSWDMEFGLAEFVSTSTHPWG